MIGKNINNDTRVFPLKVSKYLGSTTIFTAVSEPALDIYGCAFKCAAGTKCQIWEFKVYADAFCKHILKN